MRKLMWLLVLPVMISACASNAGKDRAATQSTPTPTRLEMDSPRQTQPPAKKDPPQLYRFKPDPPAYIPPRELSIRPLLTT